MSTHPCATNGLFRICWPKRSVLKIGFRAPPPEDEDSAFAAFFAEGMCARENLSDVAFGMVIETLMEEVYAGTNEYGDGSF